MQSGGLSHSDDILAQKSLHLLTKKRLAGKEEKIVQSLSFLKDSIEECRQVVRRFLDSKFDLALCTKGLSDPLKSQIWNYQPSG
jgi:hypothetical protein